MLGTILNVCFDILVYLMVALIILGVFADFMHWKRKKEIILVDMGLMFDILPIIKRGVIWVENNKDKTLNDYLQAHLSEAMPFAETITKVIKYQQEGYTLVFYTEMPNCLRVQLAKHLNNWKLVGELYLNFNDDFGDAAQFREICIREVSRKKDMKIVGIVDSYRLSNKSADKFYAERGIKVY